MSHVLHFSSLPVHSFMLSVALKLKADLFLRRCVCYKAVRHTLCHPSPITHPCTSVLDPHDDVLMTCYISSTHVRPLSCLRKKEREKGYISRGHRAPCHQKFNPRSVTWLFVSRTVNQFLEICQAEGEKMLLTLHIHHTEKAHWKLCLKGIDHFIIEHNLA